MAQTLPDPQRATREQYTQYLTSLECAPNAVPRYAKLHKDLRHLLDLLAHYPAMAPNLQQTYSTPAASKDKVYFMWDFIGRTLGMLNQIDPKLPSRTKDAWEDVYGRASYGRVLIKDTTGVLQRTNASVGYKDDAGVEFGRKF
ncbi:hypothetical protein LTR66_007665 [Elasticomyces elasticus]|nr:hypothetical protein LTR28_008167 [Elasticomyces elasticus]KAK4987172.1 hypothetical protein LTR66_007665 [Elasticomyces elasticus]